jgi:LytTr DNA-binding domain
MTTVVYRLALARDAVPALIVGGVAILLFAGYCQIHSWFDAASVPFNVSFRWGLAMGIPTAAAGLFLWRYAPPLARWVNGRIASAVALWAVIAAIGVTLGAGVHVVVADAGFGDFPAKLLSRMYDLIPEVAALAAFTVCLILLRHTIQMRPALPDSPSSEWLSFPEAPTLLLKTSDIQFIRSAGNYCEIHTKDRTHLVRITLAQATERFAPLGFLRIHRTLAVNSRCIVELDRSQRTRTPSARITNGDRLPIGKAYLAAVRSALEEQR